MRVFVAGGSGVLGQRLVSQLVARGHQVTATTMTGAKLRVLAELGAWPVVMDGLDGVWVGEAVAMAQPEAIVHQMSAMPMSPARLGTKHLDRCLTQTNRLRTEGTDHLLSAAQATGVSHVVARSHVSCDGIHRNDAEAAAIRHVEDVVVEAGGAALRYGGLYGPGIDDDRAETPRKWRFPLVASNRFWVHLDDAASATVLAVERRAEGVFDIVDDEPAQARAWLPYLARCAGAKRPGRVPAGQGAKAVVGRSNARAKRELGWQLRYPSWRQGSTEERA
ncbi:NAD-dependent epimerase/dehydratase family protein [Nonomuraea maritima]|uniref:NAD-dependent epimerase/dehydratase family protein n=1 Tax=Nonomuraea maritima TaxID=683260 RepID=UPI00371AB8E5